MLRSIMLTAAVMLWLPLLACDPVTSADDVGSARRDAGSGSDAATGNDASSGSDAATVVPCGAVTLIGDCQGTVARWCYEGGLQEYDCAGDGMGCGMVDCSDPDCFGFWCVASTGGACGLSEGDAFCNGGNGEGCIGGVCAASTTCGTGSYVDTCSDATTVTLCIGGANNGMVWDFDCGGGGTQPYVCGAASSGDNTCLGTEGGGCNLTNDPPFECAAGFTCSTSSGEGTCSSGSADGGSPADAG